MKCPNTKTLAHFEWEAQNFIEAGGEITLVSAGKSNAEYTVKLPPHSFTSLHKEEPFLQMSIHSGFRRRYIWAAFENWNSFYNG
ncbi:hypothetical protein QJQ08_00165 [Chlamydia suis]|uniref:hypothetical protein n=1 Tax=Chlamydia suis TaxID=83559 RepID=UPI002B3D5700|nr:hypothetical protein [Chlamydia suis]MEB2694235.1 hypothetical protein [Chlamydia suis]